MDQITLLIERGKSCVTKIVFALFHDHGRRQLKAERMGSNGAEIPGKSKPQIHSVQLSHQVLNWLTQKASH